MNTLYGFKEQYGIAQLKEEYVKRQLFDTAVAFGFEEIVVPILEKATSFSESVVGQSPWPEWNKKGVFKFDIVNYDQNYNEGQSETVVLIPEGTVSITRWLADRINDGVNLEVFKLFYTLNCYRNELICSLNKTKRREFQQFGMEIMNSQHIFSDVEILYMICINLERLGIVRNQIRIRLNDISIFNMLVSDSQIEQTDTIQIKELLDYLAESKAGKHADDYVSTKQKIYLTLQKYSMSDSLKKMWKIILESSYNELESIREYFDEKYHIYFDRLQDFSSSFAKESVNIAVDLCVIRSHEYYTGLSFEVDVITEKEQFIEIAGGGRYDRLVGHFLNENNKLTTNKIPCTGFAFGLERLVNMIDKIGLFEDKKTLNSVFDFDEKQTLNIYPENSEIKSYFKAIKSANNHLINIQIK